MGYIYICYLMGSIYNMYIYIYVYIYIYILWDIQCDSMSKNGDFTSKHGDLRWCLL